MEVQANAGPGPLRRTDSSLTDADWFSSSSTTSPRYKVQWHQQPDGSWVRMAPILWVPDVLYPAQRKFVEFSGRAHYPALQSAYDHGTVAVGMENTNICTLAEILKVERFGNRMLIHMRGFKRIRLLGVQNEEGSEMGLVEPFDDHKLDDQQQKEAERLGRQLIYALDDFTRKFENNSMWRSILRRLPELPSSKQGTDLSFWVASTLPPQVNSATRLQLFRGRDTCDRLRKVLDLFKAYPPVRQGTLRPETQPVRRAVARLGYRRPAEAGNSLNSSTVTEVANAGRVFASLHTLLQDDVASVESSSSSSGSVLTEDIVMRPPLSTLCVDLVVRKPYEFIDRGDMSHLNARCAQMVVDRLAHSCELDLPILESFVKVGISSLSLVGSPVDCEWLAVIQQFTCLRKLDLSHSYTIESGDVSDCLSCLSNLEFLSLERCKKIKDPALEPVSSMTELKTLRVDGTLVTIKGVLKAIKNLKQLTYLDVTGIKITQDNMECLASAKFVPGLRDLFISGTSLNCQSASYMEAFRSLERLEMSFFPRVQDWSFMACLSKVQDLDLSLNVNIDDQALGVVAREMPDLKHLILAKTDISSHGLEHLVDLDMLTTLDLSRCAIDDSCGPHLARITSVQVLSLSYTNVSDEIMPWLEPLSSLRSLKLTGLLELHDVGLYRLFRTAPQLVSLDVGSRFITDHGLFAIGNMNNLEVLQLWGTAISNEGATEICQRTSLVQVTNMTTTKGTFIFMRQAAAAISAMA
eukprot:Clim_evm27s224 gene=Clim_evmTU27s224